MGEKRSLVEVPPHIKEMRDRNAKVSESIYKFLLENGDKKDNFMLTWHRKNIALEDGREGMVNAQALTRVKAWGDVVVEPDKSNALRIVIKSSKEGIVGYTISEQILSHQIDEYTIVTGPDASCVGVERNTETGKYNMLVDYSKVLSSVVKALGIQ